MLVTKKELPKSQIELTISVPVEELQKYLESAAQEISEKKPPEGFRPGKAPFALIKERVGEQALLQQATSEIIGQTYYLALEQEGLETVEQPKIEVTKIAPGNPFEYKAVVSLIPNVELADYAKLKVKAFNKIEVKDEEVEKIISNIRNMRATEALVDREVKDGDKTELSFETFVDGVAIPGGKSEKYTLVIGSKQMIPGFEEQLIGLKKDETKEFELSFPKDYHNDKLSGKAAKFQVKMLAVYERILPEVNEEFATGLGVKDKEALYSQIKHNIEHEKTDEERNKKDMEIINLLIDKSKFAELPDSLINEEAHKMVHELEENVSRQGLSFADYLTHLKKTEAELLLDFTPDAIKRVKTSLAIRALVKQANITVGEEEINGEIDLALKSYQFNPQYAAELPKIEENMKSENGRRYFANVIANRKAFELLRTAMIEHYEAHDCGDNCEHHH